MLQSNVCFLALPIAGSCDNQLGDLSPYNLQTTKVTLVIARHLFVMTSHLVSRGTFMLLILSVCVCWPCHLQSFIISSSPLVSLELTITYSFLYFIRQVYLTKVR